MASLTAVLFFIAKKIKDPLLRRGSHALQAFGFVIIVGCGQNADHIKGKYDHDDPKG